MAIPAFVLPLVVGASAGTALGAVFARPVEPTLLSGGQTTQLSKAIAGAGLVVGIGLAAVLISTTLRR